MCDDHVALCLGALQVSRLKTRKIMLGDMQRLSFVGGNNCVEPNLAQQLYPRHELRLTQWENDTHLDFIVHNWP